MPRAGRPTKLTPAIHQAIVKAVREGITPTRAGQLVGVSERIVCEWIARGEGSHPDRPPTPLYEQFARDIEKAWAEDEQRRLKKISEIGNGGQVVSERITVLPDGTRIRDIKRAQGQFAAHSWVLERTRPEYALRTHQTTTHDVSEPMKILLEQWQRLRELPPPAREALPPGDYTDAEVVPMGDIPRPGATSRGTVYALLDKLNGDEGVEEDNQTATQTGE